MKFKIGDTVKITDEYLEKLKHMCGWANNPKEFVGEKAIIEDIASTTIYLNWKNKSKKLSCAWSEDTIELC